MVLKQSAVHLLVGCWLLTGLLVGGLNGYRLMTLLDASLPGYSDGLRAVHRGIQQFQMLLTSETEVIGSGMELLANRFSSVAMVADEQRTEKKTMVPLTAEKREAALPVKLPSLAGIISSRSTNGSTSRLALLDGAVLSEGDRLRDLTVKGISIQGVLLARGGQTWFLKAPEITHSLTAR
jgi:hypothetical protein